MNKLIHTAVICSTILAFSTLMTKPLQAAGECPSNPVAVSITNGSGEVSVLNPAANLISAYDAVPFFYGASGLNQNPPNRYWFTVQVPNNQRLRVSARHGYFTTGPENPNFPDAHLIPDENGYVRDQNGDPFSTANVCTGSYGIALYDDLAAIQNGEDPYYSSYDNDTGFNSSAAATAEYLNNSGSPTPKTIYLAITLKGWSRINPGDTGPCGNAETTSNWRVNVDLVGAGSAGLSIGNPIDAVENSSYSSKYYEVDALPYETIVAQTSIGDRITSLNMKHVDGSTPNGYLFKFPKTIPLPPLQPPNDGFYSNDALTQISRENNSDSVKRYIFWTPDSGSSFSYEAVSDPYFPVPGKQGHIYGNLPGAPDYPAAAVPSTVGDGISLQGSSIASTWISLTLPPGATLTPTLIDFAGKGDIELYTAYSASSTTTVSLTSNAYTNPSSTQSLPLLVKVQHSLDNVGWLFLYDIEAGLSCTDPFRGSPNTSYGQPNPDSPIPELKPWLPDALLGFGVSTSWLEITLPAHTRIDAHAFDEDGLADIEFYTTCGPSAVPLDLDVDYTVNPDTEHPSNPGMYLGGSVMYRHTDSSQLNIYVKLPHNNVTPNPNVWSIHYTLVDLGTSFANSYPANPGVYYSEGIANPNGSTVTLSMSESTSNCDLEYTWLDIFVPAETSIDGDILGLSTVVQFYDGGDLNNNQVGGSSPTRPAYFDNETQNDTYIWARIGHHPTTNWGFTYTESEI